MARREGDHGDIYWRRSKSHDWKLVVRGDVGTELVRKMLLSEDPADNPGNYPKEKLSELVEGLDGNWKEMQRFFIGGGVMSRPGIFVPFKRKDPAPGTNLAKYGRDRLRVIDLPAEKQPEYRAEGFKDFDALYFSAPNLYTRLQAFPKHRQGYDIELDEEPSGWNFLREVSLGFRNRFHETAPYLALSHNIFPIDAAIDQKLYELAMRARREVVLAQALRS